MSCKRAGGSGLGHRWVAALLLCLVAGPAGAADQLDWDNQRNEVSAEIQAWPLPTLLKKLTGLTGWRIYVEPETTHTVSAKFKGRAPGEALQLLLGHLSFALLPQTNGPPKLFVFRTSLDEATQLIRPADQGSGGAAIPDELIVTLKPGGKVDELARKLGAQVLGRSEALNAYRLKFADEAATRVARELLKRNAGVAGVDFNYLVQRPPEPDALMLGASPALRLNPKPLGEGNAVVVGLVDTAVQPFNNRLDAFLLPAVSVAGEAKPPAGEPTHGTSMSETVLRGLDLMLPDGQATAVRILPVDVYGTNGMTTTYEVALGIQAAINHGANLLNLSLGGEGENALLHRVIQMAHDKGIALFAAAGNNPDGAPVYPAAYPEVVAVTAGDRKGHVAAYANHGDFVDVAAPGSSIINFHNQSYLVSGTSASTAYAVGMAAALAEQSRKGLADVEAMIRSTLAVKKE